MEQWLREEEAAPERERRAGTPAPATQQSSRTADEARDLDPEIQAALLPSLISCLRDELGIPGPMSEAAVVETACEFMGVPKAGPLVGRARACLVALGV